ncbi:fimbrial protein [Yersinia enterocolitica]|uniref:hypothetical protein n=1 Tax=Yersinia enterocolitica TaxID=630 RepID=UPI0029ACC4AA|nr:hypothetical protein [Yersinia enterocolitica]HEI6740024.1 hypothetical protein [Yersinia enterocolitica]HEI6857284.1 hypothetical protein [Yersinia enterocolitica]
MKKNVITSVVALGMVSGLAHAIPSQDVTFTGSVTAVTCDLTITGEGANGSLPNQVALGTAKVGEKAQPVEFVFKPSQVAGNQDACDAMQDSNKASITWFGSTFDGKALTNASGSATGAYVELMAKNADADDSGKVVTASGTEHKFPASYLKTGGEGLKYTAQLDATGAQAGSVETVARYAFSYK